jgi:hypothetical protein
MVEPDRPQALIRRMRFACWVTEATDTPGICNTYCCSTAKMVRGTRLIVTLYEYCLSCFLYFWNIYVT